MAALFAACLAGPAAADIVCPDSSYCTVVFNRTYGTNSQFAGDLYDYVTIAPDAAGETFFNLNGVNEPDGLADIDIRVYLRNCSGAPLVGVPAQEVVVFNSALCICPGGNISDAGTDVNGCARFTGTMAAGGCVTSLDVFADGVFICTLTGQGARTVKVNSPDYAHQATSPCFTDGSDLAFFATQLGKNDAGRICSDFNELSQAAPNDNIDGSDLAFFASFLGAACQ
jgi:hypothetical protein